MYGSVIATVVFRGVDGSRVKPVCDATAKSVCDAVFNIVCLHVFFHLVNGFPSPMKSCRVIAPYDVLCSFLCATQTTFVCILVVHRFKVQSGGKEVVAAFCD